MKSETQKIYHLAELEKVMIKTIKYKFKEEKSYE